MSSFSFKRISPYDAVYDAVYNAPIQPKSLEKSAKGTCRGRMITAGKILGGTVLAAAVVFGILGLLQAHGIDLKANWLSKAVDTVGQLGPKATFGAMVGVGGAIGLGLAVMKCRQAKFKRTATKSDEIVL